MKSPLAIGLVCAVVGAVAGAVASYFITRPSPLAHVKCVPLVGVAPLNVECFNEGARFSTSIWQINDVGFASVRDVDPLKHKFESSGEYEITLTVHGHGKDSFVQPILVREMVAVAKSHSIRIVASVPESSVIETRAIPVSLTNDSHPNFLDTHTESYQGEIPARSGYKIIGAEVVEKSATRVSNLTLTPTEEGDSLKYSLNLTSGPQVDRYRGWFHGDIVIKETREVPSQTVELASEIIVANEGAYPLNASIEDIGSIITILNENGMEIVSGAYDSPLGV